MGETIKIGIFGAWRGSNYADIIKNEDPGVIKLVAVCDRHEDKLSAVGDIPGVRSFGDFESFMDYGRSVGMNAVFLCNYFHQHAEFAIKAMENGMDVVSECTSAATLAECVSLVRCAERTGRRYILAENYPFMALNLGMKKIVDGGTLGTLLYAEGEYNHSGPIEDIRELTPFNYHWRAWMPRTYYLTHALGPIMYMTGSVPAYVSARAAHSGLLEEINGFRKNDDGTAIMLCEMDNGLIARFTGCTAMASDYSRYRIVGDRGSCEHAGYTDGKVRLFYEPYTKPSDAADEVSLIDPCTIIDDEVFRKAGAFGHGGGDYYVVKTVIDCFAGGREPFFDVYKGTAMSATAILAWRSCLNHGKNYKVPDFRREEDRAKYENDTLTPFPDEDGGGATLPSSLYFASKQGFTLPFDY